MPLQGVSGGGGLSGVLKVSSNLEAGVTLGLERRSQCATYLTVAWYILSHEHTHIHTTHRHTDFRVRPCPALAMSGGAYQRFGYAGDAVLLHRRHPAVHKKRSDREPADLRGTGCGTGYGHSRIAAFAAVRGHVQVCVFVAASRRPRTPYPSVALRIKPSIPVPARLTLFEYGIR